MRKFPATIHKTNYSDAWKILSRKYSKAKQCAAVEKGCAIVGNTLFLLLMLFFGCGMLIQYQVPLAADFLKSSSWFYTLWLDVAILLATTGLSTIGQSIICAALVYLIPFAVCAVLALLIRICYHPEQPTQPEGTELEKAEALRNLGKQTLSLTRRFTASAAIWTTILFVLTVGVLITVCILHTYQTGQLDVEQILGTGNVALILMVAAFSLLLGYAFLNYIFRKLLKVLHICRLPKEMMYTLELYCEQCRPEEKPTKAKEKL